MPIGERTLIMGILNVTPDSASATADNSSPSTAALAHAEQMIAEGADIIDVGGESTRPGGEPVSVEEEIERVVPVIEALAQRTGHADLCRHNQIGSRTRRTRRRRGHRQRHLSTSF